MNREIFQPINARSALFITLSYLDYLEQPETPAVVRYCVVDPTDDTTVRDWTTVSAAQSLVITLDSDDTAMQGGTTRTESRRAIVEAEFANSKDRDVSIVDFVVRRAGAPA